MGINAVGENVTELTISQDLCSVGIWVGGGHWGLPCVYVRLYNQSVALIRLLDGIESLQTTPML